MVGAEEPGPVAHGLGTEAGPGPVRHTAVERDPEDGDVADVDVLAPRQPGEGRGTGEPWDDERVERTDRGALVLRSLAVRVVCHRDRC
jgi:hypothetical protein